MQKIVPGADCRTRSSGSLHDDIVRYYDQCYWDYRTSWMNGDNLAIHYGYWDEATRDHSQSLLNMNRELADAAAIQPGERVLDAGCGVGGSALWLAAQRGAEVVGITLSETQRAKAQDSARRRGLERATFQVADFTRMPYADGSFDVVWGIESFCHAENKLALLREAFRVLRPGGRVVCSDGYAAKTDFSADEWRIVTTCLNGWAIPNLATVPEFEDYLREAGFDSIRFRDVTPNILPSSRRLYRTASLTFPMQKVMAWLRLRNPVQSGNFYTALNQYRIFRDGLSRYGIFLGVKS